jgi:membrane associated rhomboid family serine protease
MNTVNPMDLLRSFFTKRSALSRLILINICVFIFINLAGLVFWLYKAPYSDVNVPVSKIGFWLAIPAWLPSLFARPWTLFTYMFVHEDFLHILFNMLVLYFSGTLFTTYLDEKKMVSTYIWGGLTGAVFFILAYNVFPVFSDSLLFAMAIGASASVLAILIAVATLKPNAVVQLVLFGQVKLKYIALVLVAIDLLSIKQGNAGGHIAHLGGAFWGFIYIKLLLGKYRGFSIPFRLKRKKKPFRNVYSGQRPVSDDEYNTRKVEEQAKIDSILEKISKSGYDKLTKEEKELLFKSGNK